MQRNGIGPVSEASAFAESRAFARSGSLPRVAAASTSSFTKASTIGARHRAITGALRAVDARPVALSDPERSAGSGSIVGAKETAGSLVKAEQACVAKTFLGAEGFAPCMTCGLQTFGRRGPARRGTKPPTLRARHPASAVHATGAGLFSAFPCGTAFAPSLGVANQRTSLPTPDAGGLDEILELVQALRNSYGDEVVRRVAAVMAPSPDGSESPEVLHARIARELEGAAADHAERLLDQWQSKIDCADSWVASMGRALDDLVVVLVDPLCPRLPEAADAFPDGASLQPRELVARMLREVAPATARNLQYPSSPGTQAVVAFTFGRVLACERDLPMLGTA
jgi:hypothetical protein